ncbi:glycosyltransferase [Brevundimonas sp. 2R-24]|uniref:Glycosyltransferase n=1 Tax=Peiella sedimenti TaxID=3061083 RepID=A0ABT8SMX5_9CAUL|nr:glycosyltransferase [Caulobacteraceae bacterium XZ-24]
MHLLGSGGDGGAETYFTDLVRAQHASGLALHAGVRVHPSREAALREAGVAATVFRFGGLLDFTTRPRIEGCARAIDARVLIAWMNRAARHTPVGPWARVGRLGGYYKLKNYRGFDLLVGNTVSIRDWMVEQGWPADKARHIPNFAEPQDMAPADRAALATPEGVPALLSMGRLHPAKAHDVALKALADIPEAVLWIAGSGPLERELKALADELGVAGRVRWLGWRNDASALYRAADLVVFPSRYEPLGNVVIQAWAHGAPVVAARAAGPEALIRDGEDGVLVPIDDAGALAAAIRSLLAASDARTAMAQAGLARVTAEFSRAAVLPQWAALFDELRPV